MKNEAKAKQEPNKLPAGIYAQRGLLNKIKNREFKNDQPLRESVIAKELGLSRQAIREALNQMIGWGLVEYTPYCGYRIKNFSIQDALEWYEIREAIEPIAARKLAESASQEVISRLEEYLKKEKDAREKKDKEKATFCDLMFHATVIANCGNKRFAQMQNISYLAASFYLDERLTNTDLNLQGRKLSRPLKDHSQDELNELNDSLILEWHRKMLDAIKNRKPDEAEEAFRIHAKIQVESVKKEMKKQLEESEKHISDIMDENLSSKILEGIFA